MVSRIEYSTSGVNVVSSRPCVTPLPRIKMPFFVINVNRRLAPNITFLPKPPFLHEKVLRISNEIQHLEKIFIRISMFS